MVLRIDPKYFSLGFGSPIFQKWEGHRQRTVLMREDSPRTAYDAILDLI